MEEAGAGASSTASAASASSPTLPQERRARPRPRRRHRGRLGRHSAVVPMLSVVLLVLLQSIVPAAGFSSLQLPCSSRRLSRELLGNWMCRAKRRTTTSARWLAPLPIPEEEAKATFPLPLGYRLGLVEGRDLPQLTRLFLACFPPDQPMAFPEGSDLVTRRLVRPIYHLVSALATYTAKFELRYGLLSRHGERFAAPSLQGGSLESLSLGVEEETTGRLVAVVELCMRTPDGNLISSIKGPTLRFDSSCRPYLCNLAVLPAYRGQGLGRALARHAERVVGVFWKEKVIYLHLDESDPAASSLWAAMGYTRVLGAGPTGWYQEMMFDAAAQAGQRLAFHAKWLELAGLPQQEAPQGAVASDDDGW